MKTEKISVDEIAPDLSFTYFIPVSFWKKVQSTWLTLTLNRCKDNR